jgi:hypothetical protein
MSVWHDYYADYSDGFASRKSSGDEGEGLAHSDSASAPAEMDQKRSTLTLVSVHDAVDPWSEIAKINDVEALIAEFWHLLTLCFSDLRAGSVEFVSSHIPFCADHHLSTVEGYIESLDLLCNSLPHLRAKKLRIKLTAVRSSLSSTKAERLDCVLAELEGQQVLVRQLQETIAHQHSIISALQAQLLSTEAPGFSESRSSEAARLSPPLPLSDTLGNAHQTSDLARVCQGVSVQSRAFRSCGGCGTVVAKKRFSQTQWRKPEGKCRTCVSSLPSLAPAPSPSSPSSSLSFSLGPLSPCCAPSLSLPTAMTLPNHVLIGGQQPVQLSSENPTKSSSTTVSPPNSAFSSPKHSYTSLQINSVGARGGVSPVEQKSGLRGVGTVCASVAEVGTSGVQ